MGPGITRTEVRIALLFDRSACVRRRRLLRSRRRTLAEVRITFFVRRGGYRGGVLSVVHSDVRHAELLPLLFGTRLRIVGIILHALEHPCVSRRHTLLRRLRLVRGDVGTDGY